MKTSDFDYQLPQELIAQTPLEPRDHSRLMVLDRKDRLIEHHTFTEITSYLDSGDTLVFNNSRVIPARLFGYKVDSGTKVELLLLRRWDKCLWETLARPGKRLKKGTTILLQKQSHESDDKKIMAEIIEQQEGGIRIVRFENESLLEELGEIPLPPYIHTPLSDSERYQTVYSKIKGSVAAPTAGLHFTPGLLGQLEQKGIHFAFVTLHIGLDTFQPVRLDDAEEHSIHTEYGELTEEAAILINQSRNEGKKVIVVGTSTARIVEAASESGRVKLFKGEIDLFILPGYRFRTTDAIITNFHLPKSTLIMMVSAFAGREFVLQAYEQAIAESYRFYSFGDAMMIL
jgi:S-adenosylmethionine:tRNA ribosyltransferase-isomerase